MDDEDALANNTSYTLRAGERLCVQIGGNIYYSAYATKNNQTLYLFKRLKKRSM